MLVSVSSVKGAPGVSSWSLLLAAAWPHNADRVLVEADGSGGIVAARYDFPMAPGVTDLVSQVRRGSFDSAFAMDSVGRLLRPQTPEEEQLWVVPAPIASHESVAAWANLAKPAATAMARDRRLWVADCGRVWSGSPVEVLITSADRNVIISDDAVPSLVVLQSRVQSIQGKVAVIVVGSPKHTEAELQHFTGADMVWQVPRFNGLAERAGDAISNSKRARRSKAWQAALRIAHDLAEDAAMDGRIAAPPVAPSPHEPPQPQQVAS